VEFPSEQNNVPRFQVSMSVTNCELKNKNVEPLTVNLDEKKSKQISLKKCAQNLRNRIPKKWTVNCLHKDANSSRCKVASLTKNDIECFKNDLCQLTSKIDQDKFLLTLMTVEKPKRTNRGKGIRQERTVVTYFIPNNKGKNIQVCLNAFVKITTITRRRLNILALRFKDSNESPKELRGGFSLKKKIKSEKLNASICNHIQQIKYQKGFGSRSDINQSYSQLEWSVMKLWNHWKNERETLQQPIASYSKYYKVFTKHFDLTLRKTKKDDC